MHNATTVVNVGQFCFDPCRCSPYVRDGGFIQLAFDKANVEAHDGRA